MTWECCCDISFNAHRVYLNIVIGRVLLLCCFNVQCDMSTFTFVIRVAVYTPCINAGRQTVTQTVDVSPSELSYGLKGQKHVSWK